ncbi:MAG TPA: DEAD/DEAH box helicase [Vicinamibacterales bacterium]|jgi:DEAD/DEAH box helicase domain-containing protein|nr:DEAD/DEAH box helicase [Vicinamibacterales bacterium]
MAAQTLPVVSGDKDRALQEAVARLGLSPRPGGPAADPIVTATRRLPAVAAQYAPFPSRTDARLRAALAARGIEQLYTHQAEAFEHALGGRNVVTITPTASGKTLCYNAPVLDAILKDPSTRALYLFPTKALAQDQLAELHALVELLMQQHHDEDAGAVPEIGVFTYDGDTPSDARRAIRGKAHVVLSNPDMLHSGILPHHPRWAKLFENLRFVIVDELHAYRGVFGSHLANIMRRLQRVCRHYGSDPLFICSSATIANPRELAEGLTGRPFELVDRSGAPRGEKFFLFVNPPVVNAQLGIRRSYLSEARRVSLEFLKHNLQLILFAQSRLATEILTTYLKDAYQGPTGTSDAVRGYRGGYLPNRRREIERGLREGSVRAVVSTNALELGIDIGALDVAVLAGYPGTIAATWQRAGRAGRRSTRSAAVLVASSAPIDQYVIRNPSYFFDASPEHALINPDNLHILIDHVKCAAFELPFATDDQFGSLNVQEILAVLAEEGYVHAADSQWNWTHESYPADAVSLRSVSSDNFVVVDTTAGERVIAETDFTSGPATLHEKAIYIIEGQLFQVERLDFEGRKAYVRAVDCDYYTDAITYTKVTILDTFEERGARAEDVDGTGEERLAPVSVGPPAPLAARSSHGEVHVVSRVVGFKKIKFYTNENVGSGELDLPEQQMHTSSYWLTIPAGVMQALPFAGDDKRDGVVGLAFAMKNVAQLLLMCDAHDIGLSVDGGSLERSARTGGAGGVPDALAVDPNIFVYDNYPGGIGFSRPLFEMDAMLLERTRELIATCPCESGCPSCVGPEGNTGPRAKHVASHMLDLLCAPSTEHQAPSTEHRAPSTDTTFHR